MASFADTAGIPHKPVHPDCVKWSEDGLLAVAAAHSAVVLNPGDLGGPRGSASPGRDGSTTVLQAPGCPRDPTADVHYELAQLRSAATTSSYPAVKAELLVRSLAWSPAGCTLAGGCLLTMVTNDHKVRWCGAQHGAQIARAARWRLCRRPVWLAPVPATLRSVGASSCCAATPRRCSCLAPPPQ